MTRAQRRTLEHARRFGQITIATLMREDGFTMREAVRHLVDMERAGLVERLPAERRGPIFWQKRDS